MSKWGKKQTQVHHAACRLHISMIPDTHTTVSPEWKIFERSRPKQRNIIRNTFRYICGFKQNKPSLILKLDI